MGKISVLIIGILLISHQLHESVAFDAIRVTSAVIGLGKSVYSMMNELFVNKKSGNEVAILIQNLNQEIQYDITRVMNILKDLPSIIRLELKKETLDGHFAMIGQVFEEASRIKKEVDVGIIDRNNSKYKRFALKEKDIDHSIYEIRRILTDSNTIFVLKRNFTEDSKKFDNVCKTGMSHLQLLDALLGNLKAVTAEYYLTRKFMYEFLELTGEDNSNAKRTLLENVHADYSNAVKRFKDIMRDASLELWACDPVDGYNDTVRFTNEKDPDFAELRIFSKYIVNEDNFAGEKVYCENTKCNAITKLDSCGKWDSRLCKKVRLCPGKLIGCQQYTYSAYQSELMADICRNNDKNAYHRYQSIVSHNEPSENFHCDKTGNKATIQSTVFQSLYTPVYYCDYCKCLCEEQEYNVDTQFVGADTESNRVVTGAKLLVENNTLRVQIQQAKLMVNGTIDKDTLEWKPLKPIRKSNCKKISFDEFRKFALSSVIKPDSQVVTGISLFAQLPQKMIYLFVAGDEFDFVTGKLKRREADVSANYRNLGKIPTEKYDVSERDASTKSKKENKPISMDLRYVELSVTNLAKDGGQSVVPFIDTQNITANGPLSGASFYIRGQPGFGGFLALKLYTFDIRNYVVDGSDL